MNYKVQEHLKPKALAGISDDQITQHWALYEGYVKNANLLLEGAAKAEAGPPRVGRAEAPARLRDERARVARVLLRQPRVGLEALPG